MEIVKYVNGAFACFSRVKLASGEQVMVSVAAASVRVVRMAWGGLIPRETLWEGEDRVQMGLMLRCSHEDAGALLDGFTALALVSPSARTLRHTLGDLDARTRPWRRRSEDGA